MKILQVGLGGFGKNHLRAWAQLGKLENLYLSDLDAGRLREARELFGIPETRASEEYRTLIDQVDVVDIVTPSDGHYRLCMEALRCGKDVFVEKPMTMSSAEADALATEVESSRRVLQVGYYYRYHPISVYVRERIRTGELGRIRYLSGEFMGFKRARTDVGVTHTDAIHFIDLFNWLLDGTPHDVHAVIRDHFGRGMEDLSVALFRYPQDVIAKVESGYIQPGNWVDRVVPNAMTTKEITVVGERGTIRADYEIDKVEVFEIRHELQNGVWTPIFGPCVSPRTRSVTPVELVALELDAFLNAVTRRAVPDANATACGRVLARVMEALYDSARNGHTVSVEPLRETIVAGER